MFSREVGLALQNLKPERLVVMESPRIRRYDRLLRKHNAAWILDLHDCVSLRSTYKGPTGLARLYIHCKDEQLYEHLRHFCQLNGYWETIDHVGIFNDLYAYYRHPRFIAVEMHPWRSQKKNAKLVMKLGRYLAESPLENLKTNTVGS